MLAAQELSSEMCLSKMAEVMEKLLKAELIRTGWPLRKTHDLIELGQEIAERSPELLAQVKPLCDAFAQKYRVDRYPGFDVEDEDWPALRAHVEAVGDLLKTIEDRLAS